nr:MAG TPA: Cell Wall Hydrolase [Caudoviricetes sp.]
MNCKNDIEVLARTIYGEARGEKQEGRIAVANVVMNRLLKKKQAGYEIVRGQRLAGVAATCLKPFQFSCWLKDDPNLEVIKKVTTDDAVFAECWRIATKAVHKQLADITNGATHYYSPRGCKCPTFAEGKKPCAIIGNHYFFNDID